VYVSLSLSLSLSFSFSLSLCLFLSLSLSLSLSLFLYLYLSLTHCSICLVYVQDEQISATEDSAESTKNLNQKYLMHETVRLMLKDKLSELREEIDSTERLPACTLEILAIAHTQY